MTRNTVDALLFSGSARLAAAGIEQPGREARMLLAQALGLDAVGLLGLGRGAMVEAVSFEALLERRCRREPMAFLTGRCGFWSLDLAVSGDTLIPRADSETVVEAVLAALPDRTATLRVLDLGTGTGCLLLAVLAEYGRGFGVGVDLSAAAAGLARRNAVSNGLAARSAFLCGDWDSALGSAFDLVVSNPPYIPSADLAGLMPEVHLFEPSRALDGGADGLAAYRHLVPALHGRLRTGGIAVFELGIGQAPLVAGLARDCGFDVVAITADLGGLARAITLRAPGQKTFGKTGRGS